MAAASEEAADLEEVAEAASAEDTAASAAVTEAAFITDREDRWVRAPVGASSSLPMSAADA